MSTKPYIIPLDEFIKDYEELIIPTYFVQNFKSEKEFIKWLSTGTASDIDAVLKVFQENELYEHCVIILNYQIKNGLINYNHFPNVKQLVKKK